MLPEFGSEVQKHVGFIVEAFLDGSFGDLLISGATKHLSDELLGVFIDCFLGFADVFVE